MICLRRTRLASDRMRKKFLKPRKNQPHAREITQSHALDAGGFLGAKSGNAYERYGKLLFITRRYRCCRDLSFFRSGRDLSKFGRCDCSSRVRPTGIIFTRVQPAAAALRYIIITRARLSMCVVASGRLSSERACPSNKIKK